MRDFLHYVKEDLKESFWANFLLAFVFLLTMLCFALVYSVGSLLIQQRQKSINIYALSINVTFGSPELTRDGVKNRKNLADRLLDSDHPVSRYIREKCPEIPDILKGDVDGQDIERAVQLINTRVLSDACFSKLPYFSFSKLLTPEERAKLCEDSEKRACLNRWLLEEVYPDIDKMIPPKWKFAEGMAEFNGKYDKWEWHTAKLHIENRDRHAEIPYWGRSLHRGEPLFASLTEREPHWPVQEARSSDGRIFPKCSLIVATGLIERLGLKDATHLTLRLDDGKTVVVPIWKKTGVQTYDFFVSPEFLHTIEGERTEPDMEATLYVRHYEDYLPICRRLDTCKISSGRESEEMVQQFVRLLGFFRWIEWVLGGAFTFLLICLIGCNFSSYLWKKKQEIGILKAYGASRSALLVIFSLESLVLSITGFGLGLLLAYPCAWFVAGNESLNRILQQAHIISEKLAPQDLSVLWLHLGCAACGVLVICGVAAVLAVAKGINREPRWHFE